jgi:hypothetical protein
MHGLQRTLIKDALVAEAGQSVLIQRHRATDTRSAVRSLLALARGADAACT